MDTSEVMNKIWWAGFEDGFANKVARTDALSIKALKRYLNGFYEGKKAAEEAKK